MVRIQILIGGDMKYKDFLIILCLIIHPLISCIPEKKVSVADKINSFQETVMSNGTKICASTQLKTICIEAETELVRKITWDGATRSVKMIPRNKRWYGKLGLYFPGPGNHWKNHNGVTRGIINEAQLHFPNKEKMLEFLNKFYDKDQAVYRDDGLYISWFSSIKPNKKAGGYLKLSIYQILVNGKKPKSLPGSQNEKITVSYYNER